MNELIGVVLGSGLGSLADRIRATERIGFAEAGLAASTVAGHAGEFLTGKLAGREVVMMRGRVHLYEGHDAHMVAAGIRWMHFRGVQRVILTNAAGSLNPGLPPGSWMMLEDHLNLTGTSPLGGGASFIDLSEVYDRGWRERAREIARRRGMEVGSGVYAGLRGPQYETPAEIRMLRTLGADAVGMSTVLEAIQARALGMKVLAFSCLTNWGAGMPGATLDHGEVVATGQGAATEMAGLLEELVGT